MPLSDQLGEPSLGSGQRVSVILVCKEPWCVVFLTIKSLSVLVKSFPIGLYRE